MYLTHTHPYKSIIQRGTSGLSHSFPQSQPTEAPMKFSTVSVAISVGNCWHLNNFLFNADRKRIFVLLFRMSQV